MSHPKWVLSRKCCEKWEWYQQGPAKIKNNGKTRDNINNLVSRVYSLML